MVTDAQIDAHLLGFEQQSRAPAFLSPPFQCFFFFFKF